MTAIPHLAPRQSTEEQSGTVGDGSPTLSDWLLAAEIFFGGWGLVVCGVMIVKKLFG